MGNREMELWGKWGTFTDLLLPAPREVQQNTQGREIAEVRGMEFHGKQEENSMGNREWKSREKNFMGKREMELWRKWEILLCSCSMGSMAGHTGRVDCTGERHRISWETGNGALGERIPWETENLQVRGTEFHGKEGEFYGKEQNGALGERGNAALLLLHRKYGRMAWDGRFHRRGREFHGKQIPQVRGTEFHGKDGQNSMKRNEMELWGKGGKKSMENGERSSEEKEERIPWRTGNGALGKRIP